MRFLLKYSLLKHIYKQTHTLSGAPLTNRSVTTETLKCHMHNYMTDLGKDEKKGARGKETEGRENKINVHLVQTEEMGATR